MGGEISKRENCSQLQQLIVTAYLKTWCKAMPGDELFQNNTSFFHVLCLNSSFILLIGYFH